MEEIVKRFFSLHHFGLAVVPFDDGEVRQDERGLQHHGVRADILEDDDVADSQRPVISFVEIVAFNAGIAAKVQILIISLGRRVVAIDGNGRILPVEGGVDVIDTAQQSGDGLSPDILDADHRGGKPHHVAHQCAAWLNEQGGALGGVLEMVGDERCSLLGILFIGRDAGVELHLQRVLHLPVHSSAKVNMVRHLVTDFIHQLAESVGPGLPSCGR